MRTLAVYLVILAAVFVAGFAIGAVAGPAKSTEVSHDHHS